MVNRPSCEATSPRRRLVLHELRGRQVPRAAELSGSDMHGRRPDGRLGQHHALDGRIAALAGDLGAERQQFVPIADERGAIDGGQPGDRVNGTTQLLLPLVRVAVRRLGLHQIGQPGKWRIDAVQDRADDRVRPIRDPAGTTSSAPPRPCARIEAASITSTLMMALSLVSSSNPSSDCTTPGHSGCSGIPLVNHLDLVPFEHGDVDELAEGLVAVLDDQQARRHDLEHEAERRQIAAWCPRRGARPDCPRHQGECPAVRRRARAWRARRDGARAARRRSNGRSAASGGRYAREIRGVTPSSRRRLAQNAASMMASIARASGSGAVTSRPRARVAAWCRLKCVCTTAATALATG